MEDGEDGEEEGKERMRQWGEETNHDPQGEAGDDHVLGGDGVELQRGEVAREGLGDGPRVQASNPEGGTSI